MWLIYQSAAIVFWAAMNVVDSMIVKHYQQNPFVLGWFLSGISLVMLSIMALFIPIATPWMWWILLGGITGYFGDLAFYRSVRELDVSIVNIAWSIMAIVMAFTSFLFFDERWSQQQFLGVFLVIGGIGVLSLWHKKIEKPRSLLWLPILGCSYVPFYVFQKWILLKGAPLFPVFFWMFIGREITTLLVPLIIPFLRRKLVAYAAIAPGVFYRWCFVAIILFTAGNFLTTAAFASGPASLVSVVGNAQPFIVLFFAWSMARIFPQSGAKELLTKQSVTIKCVSFIIVFLGLAFLAFSP